MFKTAVFGYGNVGRFAVEAVLHSGDMRLAGIADPLCAGQKSAGVTIVASAEELPDFDAAILALPSRLTPDIAARLLATGVHTADAYDIHGNIPTLRTRLDGIAKSAGARAVLAAGWDPGSDSIIRAVLEIMAPQGISYTDFGPGVSMGHSVAARDLPGVSDALSVTIPTGSGIHRRMVYVELKEGAVLADVSAAVKADDYFAHDETHVVAVESVAALRDVGHGVNIERKGVSAGAHNQLLRFDTRINGPAVTGQILACAIRAAAKQKPGCYTMIEIPPVDFLEMSREEAVHRLV